MQMKMPRFQLAHLGSGRERDTVSIRGRDGEEGIEGRTFVNLAIRTYLVRLQL